MQVNPVSEGLAAPKNGDCIVQLPDHVANQIAAGEVIQRPASAVKELMENAVDAGAERIEVRVEDAGRTLIQVLDNGSGMSFADALRSFDRHATSKLRQVDDLFQLVTKGFRGEALASIASIAQVELRTRRQADEMGTRVGVEGSRCVAHEPCAAPVGTVISVKNLFYNVPARRQFLKGDAVELRHVIDEFQRVALAHPEIAFKLFSQGTELFHLKPGSLRQRVVGVFGSKYDERLVPVDERTDVVEMVGFVGKPAHARKVRGEQFLFVNQRFIKHPGIHRAILEAYEGVLPAGHHPFYVLFLDIDPARVDVNIHPTKVEVKFDEERTIYQLLLPAVRRALGRFHVAPSLDFDQESSFQIPTLRPTDALPEEPRIAVDPTYNPFSPASSRGGYSASGGGYQPAKRSAVAAGWDWMRWPENTSPAAAEPLVPEAQVGEDVRPMFQFRQRYIVTSIRSALVLIDIPRAHARVLYERFVHQLEDAATAPVIQRLLFPEEVELGPADRAWLAENGAWLHRLGLEVELTEQGARVTGVPAEGEAQPRELLEAALDPHGADEARVSRAEWVAARWARAGAYRPGRRLASAEMTDLLDRLFGCSVPALDPFGRPVLVTFEAADIQDRFQ
ncbi:MAG: mismatch repair endonuclease MutL [Bacteroidota bacterium]